MKSLFEINLDHNMDQLRSICLSNTNNIVLGRGGHFSTVPSPPTHTYIHVHAHKRMQYN